MCLCYADVPLKEDLADLKAGPAEDVPTTGALKAGGVLLLSICSGRRCVLQRTRQFG